MFGSGTRTKLMGWQKGVKVPVTGVLDKPTWAKLVPAGGTHHPDADPDADPHADAQADAHAQAGDAAGRRRRPPRR